MSADVVSIVRALKTPYADLLPRLSFDERFALEESLREQGQTTDVVIDEFDNILDGHTRYSILGPQTRTRRFPIAGLSDAEKRAFVYRSAENRRNLSAEQRRVLLDQKKTVAFALRAQDPRMYTQQEIAKKLGVKQQTVSDWLRVTITSSGIGDTGNVAPRPDARVKLAPDKKAEAILRAVGGEETQAAVAESVGVSRSLIAKVVAEAKASGEVDLSRKRQQPRIDHAARDASIRELHDKGLGTSEIAKRLALAPTSVSFVKVKLGIAATSAPLKLWNDVDHVTSSLEGSAIAVERLAIRLEEATELATEPEEIRRCIKSLSNTCKTAKRLLSALKQKLQ